MGVLANLYKRCKKRSRAAGQPAPCRESQLSPGTCVWCFQPIDVKRTAVTIDELTADQVVAIVRLEWPEWFEESEPSFHGSGPVD